jgi:hypothetical protein
MSNQQSQLSLTPLQHLQNRFAIIDLSGAIRLVDQQQIADLLKGRVKCDVSYYQKADGNLIMQRLLESLPLPGPPKRVIEDFWPSPNTVFYNATAFNPVPTPATTLNFWVGHVPDPKPGIWVAIRDYMLEVLCAGDAQLYDYLIHYLAHMVQRPEEKPGVMIVLLGGQGTGKGVYFSLLRAIWPITTLQVSKIDQVVGKFTSALERNYIICMDEALFAGDRQAIDNLKSIVTEQYLHIEQKFQPSRTIESVHRIFAASNHEHFAHVEADDRRFVFLRVSNVHQQDTKYFSTIAAAISNPDTIKALIYYLKRKDISKFNVRLKPKTTEQRSQKIKSLQGFERFWYEVLCTGDLKGMGKTSDPWTESIFISTNNLLENYKEFNKAAEKYQPLQVSQIQETIKRVCPKAKTGIRESFTDWQKKIHQRRGIRLPDLNEARTDFGTYIGESLEWEVDEPAQDSVVSEDTDQTPPDLSFLELNQRVTAFSQL